jgi:hypothetical protein
MIVMDKLHPLTDKWRLEAALYERRGLTNFAAMARSFADELASYERERGLEKLTLTQAATETGFSKEHIGRLLETGRLPQAGEKFAPRVCRKDLPLKAKKLPTLHSGNALEPRTPGESRVTSK